LNLEEFHIAFERQAIALMLIRAERALIELVGLIQEGYYEVMKGSRGAAGSVGALNYKIQLAESFITGIIGFGKSGDYLKFVEYGVLPESGSKFDAYKKLPPVEVFAAWIRRARLSVPDKFLSRSEKKSRKVEKSRTEKKRRTPLKDSDKAILRWAWAMAVKRKRFGYKGLRVIAKVLEAHAEDIRKILES
jgi:hypothetical protein